MVHLFLLVAVLGAVAAFVMALAAASQMLGITGKIDATRFVLGPSWGWLTFDIVALFWDITIVAGCLHFWMIKA